MRIHLVGTISGQDTTPPHITFAPVVAKSSPAVGEMIIKMARMVLPPASTHANYLWDGSSIRIVDFEDADPSHRAFELALLVEHRSAWAESELDAAAFLARFDLAPPELLLVNEYLRLATLFWLI